MVKIGDIELGNFPLLLAPMEDVSDPPFRALCKKHGADLMFTEFISSEGLIRDAAKSLKKLDIFEYERPIGIQIYGNDIESMRIATDVTTQANPDIIDINYGCPVKKVACKGSGAGILQDIPKMVRLTAEIVKSTHLPVTVKTRLGWDEKTKYIVEVAERLQDVGIKAISIHGRTRHQMYKGEADWSLIAEVKTKSPFGFRSKKSWDELFRIANEHGDWLSIHTDPRWGGSFELIKKARSLTKKPILAKGIHRSDKDIKQALKLGANYVLVVGRIPKAHLNKLLIEPENLSQKLGE